MIIDTPTLADLAALMVESKPMFDEMGFDQFGNSWEYEAMVEWWTTVLTTDNHDIVVAREGNRLVGVSVVYYPAKGLWHRLNTQALELAHHAAPDLPKYQRCKIMIKMLDAITEKVKARGPLYFKMSYMPHPDFLSWGDYLRKKGFVDSGRQVTVKVG